MIGVNPAIDSIESVTRIAAALRDLLDRFGIPTCPACSPTSTQMEALNRGAPLDIVFQSIAGTEATNRQFGVTTALLKEAVR